MKLFGANKVIKLHISEADLSTFFVGFDLNDEGKQQYRLSQLVQLLINVIPEFAFGFHKGTVTDNTQLVDSLVEAAKAIYKIDAFNHIKTLCADNCTLGDSVEDKYLRRGEFGELILHLLLRDFHKTIPLLSKIYFKDADGSTVHGFDAVHIQEDTKSLWLGESKFYLDGKNGVRELIKDIKEHFTANYLNSEFAIISRKIELCTNIPKKDIWLDIMSSTTKLGDKLKSITIPLLCTYESENFTAYDNEYLDEFITDYTKEIRELKKFFDDHNNHTLKTHLNVILLLFPIQSKKDLVQQLHNKLSAMQQLGN